MSIAEYIITVIIESDAAEDAGLDAARLERLIVFALRAEGMSPPTSLSLLVTDDPGIQALHRDYMGLDTPTDVLSFAAEADESFPTDPSAGRYLGDIAVSWDTAAVQGPEAGLTTNAEVAFLALHGVLHLLGADDATDDDRAAMLARQGELLAAFDAADLPA